MVVRGEGVEAVQELLRLRTAKSAGRTVEEGTSASIAFFTAPTGLYAYIRHVERRRDRFEVCYEMVPHDSRELTLHLAMIPLGTLTEGRYDVEFIRWPLETKYVDKGFEKAASRNEQNVCRSFRFVVIPRK